MDGKLSDRPRTEFELLDLRRWVNGDFVGVFDPSMTACCAGCVVVGWKVPIIGAEGRARGVSGPASREGVVMDPSRSAGVAVGSDMSVTTMDGVEDRGVVSGIPLRTDGPTEVVALLGPEPWGLNGHSHRHIGHLLAYQLIQCRRVEHGHVFLSHRVGSVTSLALVTETRPLRVGRILVHGVWINDETSFCASPHGKGWCLRRLIQQYVILESHDGVIEIVLRVAGPARIARPNSP